MYQELDNVKIESKIKLNYFAEIVSYLMLE